MLLIRRPRSRRSHLLALAGILVATACGNDPLGPQDDLAFLVGDWEAVRFLITPLELPNQSFDLVAEGATFKLNVQPSGQYTARLTVPGLGASPELGTITVEGDELIFNRTVPGPPTESRATFVLLGPDRLVFAGPSELSLSGDGSPDPVTVEVEIQRSG
jgi:hypothetical protein